MPRSNLIVPRGSVVKKYELKIIVMIAIAWTLTDLVLFFVRLKSDLLPFKYSDPQSNTLRSIILREVNVLLLSLFIGFLMVSVMKKFLRNAPFLFNLLIKTILLVLAALLMNLFIYVTYSLLIEHRTFTMAFERFFQNTFRPSWFIPKMVEWIILFLLTQLAIEINEKYSRGVFFSISWQANIFNPRKKAGITFSANGDMWISNEIGNEQYATLLRFRYRAP